MKGKDLAILQMNISKELDKIQKSIKGSTVAKDVEKSLDKIREELDKIEF